MSGLQSRDERYSKPRVPDDLKWAPVMRGFPEETEVLTDVGWLTWEKLFYAGRNGTRTNPEPLFGEEIDFLSTLIPVQENRSANQSKHQKKHAFGNVNKIDYTRWAVKSDFPRLATLSKEALFFSHTGNARITFVRPEFAYRFMYDNHQMVHFKKRGVDMMVPRYTDVFMKARFQNLWNFTVADDFCVNSKVETTYRSIVNKYEPREALYGDVDVDALLHSSASGELYAMTGEHHPKRINGGGKDAARKRIWDLFEYPAVYDEVTKRYVTPERERTSVECFNVVFGKGTSHTLIVRRERKTKMGARKGEWVGEPIVMGDGYDKSQIRIDKLEGHYA